MTIHTYEEVQMTGYGVLIQPASFHMFSTTCNKIK